MVIREVALLGTAEVASSQSQLVVPLLLVSLSVGTSQIQV